MLYAYNNLSGMFKVQGTHNIPILSWLDFYLPFCLL